MTLTVSATNSEVPLPVNTVFNSRFLRKARPLCPYFVGSMPGRIARGEGTATVTWRRFNTSIDNSSAIAPTTSTLGELTGTASYMQGRSPDTVHRSNVTATVAKYGQFYILSEEVLDFNPGGTFEEIVDTLAVSGGRSLNRLMRNLLDDNATDIYASGTSDGDVDSAIRLADVRNAVNVLEKNAAMPFAPMTEGSTNVGTLPIQEAYWGLCHPDVAIDLVDISGFIDVQQYAGQVATMPGEFGTLPVAGTGVRFIRSPDATVDTDAGASISSFDLNAGSSSVDLYRTCIFGKEAFGSLGLGMAYSDGIFRAGDRNNLFELIVKRPEQSGTSDPFNEITTVAWKARWAGAQLNANWSRVISSGATNIAN